MCNPTAALRVVLVTEGGGGGRGGRHPTAGSDGGRMYRPTAFVCGGRVAQCAFFAPSNFFCLQFLADNI